MTTETKSLNLSIVIPLTRMFGRLENFKNMLEDAKKFKMQIIVVHDKRDDLTGPELANILLNHEDVKLIEGEYGSAGAARNAGLSCVNSEWVSFWDSDDEPNVFEFMTLLTKIKNENNSVGYGSFVKKTSNVDPQTKKPNLNFKNNNFEIVKNPGLWRWIFATDHIKKIKFPNLYLGEDICFLFSVLQITEKITVIDRVVYKYFINNPLQSTQVLKKSSLIYLIVINLNANFSPDQKNKNLILGIFVNQVYSCLKHDKLKFKYISLKIFIMRFFRMRFVEKLISIKWLLIIPFSFLNN